MERTYYEALDCVGFSVVLYFDAYLTVNHITNMLK
jgi:hypothetical protein